MAILTPFDTPIGYDTGSATDVQDIIDAFAAEATGLSSAWSDGGGGLYTSPTDAAGRWFDVLLTRIAAANLEIRVRDDNGVTICTRRIQIVSGPQTWWVSVSTHHFWIEIINATVEAAGGGLLDLSPYGQTSHGQYTWGRGSRNTSDVIDAAGDTQVDYFMDDNGTPASARRVIAQDRIVTLSNYTLLHGSGNGIWLPYLVSADFAGQIRLAGRFYNFYFGEGTGTAVVLPIGNAAETGTFRNSALSLDGVSRAMIRIG